jgi:hypothetical protein
MKRNRQRKKLKAMTPVPCSSVVSESSGSKNSKAVPLIQKKKEAVKRTQVQRMCIKLSKSQTMPNTLHENDSHEENRTNEDNISRTSILKWKQVIMNGTVSRREFVLIENVNRNRPETNVQTLTGT